MLFFLLVGAAEAPVVVEAGQTLRGAEPARVISRVLVEPRSAVAAGRIDSVRVGATHQTMVGQVRASSTFRVTEKGLARFILLSSIIYFGRIEGSKLHGTTYARERAIFLKERLADSLLIFNYW